ncbi:MAG: histidinol-phosphate transaminase [Acidobacteriota bacterium]|nr:histidinol-phosphate transaminase [Acidobacteriota bacterium]
MGKFAEIVPEHVRALPAYVPGKPIQQAEAEYGVKMTKLGSNENPFGPSPLAVKAVEAAARGVNFYPDTEMTALRERLALHHKVAANQIIVTAGSTTLLDLLARTLLGPGLNAVSSERSFIIYPLVTRAAGAEYRQVPMRNDGFDLDAISDAIDGDTRLVYIANPNNPTGTMIPAAEMDRFLNRLPENVVVALDEAYYDYAQWMARERGVDYSHAEQYVREERSVVVLRTFSKAHGLAALRVGYGMGPAELIGYLARIKPAFLVSGPAEAGALAAMDDHTHYEKSMRNNTQQLEWMKRELIEMGYTPVESWANFLYIETGEDSSTLSRRLEMNGMIVRPLSGSWGARTAIRVTIGAPAENRKFIDALKNATKGAAVR